MENSLTHLKAQIFKRTYLGPLILILLFVLKAFFSEFPFNQYVVLGLILGVSLRLLFISELNLFEISDPQNALKIEAITSLYKQKTILIPKDQIKYVYLKKGNWFFDNCSFLYIVSNTKNVHLVVIEKDRIENLKAQISKIEDIEFRFSKK